MLQARLRCSRRSRSTAFPVCDDRRDALVPASAAQIRGGGRVDHDAAERRRARNGSERRGEPIGEQPQPFAGPAAQPQPKPAGFARATGAAGHCRSRLRRRANLSCPPRGRRDSPYRPARLGAAAGRAAGAGRPRRSPVPAPPPPAQPTRADKRRLKKEEAERRKAERRSAKQAAIQQRKSTKAEARAERERAREERRQAVADRKAAREAERQAKKDARAQAKAQRKAGKQAQAPEPPAPAPAPATRAAKPAGRGARRKLETILHQPGAARRAGARRGAPARQRHRHAASTPSEAGVDAEAERRIREAEARLGRAEERIEQAQAPAEPEAGAAPPEPPEPEPVAEESFAPAQPRARAA